MAVGALAAPAAVPPSSSPAATGAAWLLWCETAIFPTVGEPEASVALMHTTRLLGATVLSIAC